MSLCRGSDTTTTTPAGLSRKACERAGAGGRVREPADRLALSLLHFVRRELWEIECIQDCYDYRDGTRLLETCLRRSLGTLANRDWRPIDPAVDRFEPFRERRRERRDDLTVLYWWLPSFSGAS